MKKRQFRLVNLVKGEINNINTSNLHEVLGFPYGQTSGSCINDFYVSNIHACSPLTIFGQVQNESSLAIGEKSFAFGDNNISSGFASNSEGSGTTASGLASHAGGVGSVAGSYGETSLGSFNTTYTPSGITSFEISDRIFNVGNGLDINNRSDAFQIIKSGEVIAPSLTEDIINSGDSRVLITKEWYNTDIDGRLLNYLSLTGGTVTGDIVADTFITDGGTSSQFVKGDGTLDSIVYLKTSSFTAHTSNTDIHFEQSEISITESQISDFGNYQPISEKGNPNGYAELDSFGFVPSSQLPGFVDDVLEYDNLSSFPVTGESGKIYIAKNTNITYRWSGTVYVKIGSDLALGETSSTAYRGDRGKIAYDHTFLTDNPHNVTKEQVGLDNVDNTSDLDKPVSTATQDALDLKVDKVVGSSLVEDTEIAKITHGNRTALDAVLGVNTGDQDISGINTNAIAIALNTAKVGITPTQASDITTNNTKITYPSTDSVKVGFISVTQPVDLDDIENKANDAVLNSDTSTIPMGFVIDEDNFASNLATKVPTQQSTKAYINSQIASAIVGGVYYQGSYDALNNVPDLEAPLAGVVFKGFMWTVTVAGDFFTEAVQIGDVLIAEVDNPSILTEWTVVQSNLDATSIKVLYESNSNTNAFTDAEKINLNNQSNTNTGDQDLSGKVDKVTGKSLVLDTEITRLENVTNQTVESLGLDNVDNTSDLDKPVSTATQDALDLKQNLITNSITGSGTTNYLPKFTGTSALGDSLVYDDGTNIGIVGDILIKNSNISNQENLDVDTGTQIIASIDSTLYTAAFFDYVIKKGTNIRCGTVYACHDGTNVEYAETSTNDLGDTSDVILEVTKLSSELLLRAMVLSDGWVIKTLVRGI